MAPLLERLSLIALILTLAGCMTPDPPYPNYVRQDTTGNYGAH